ncbi:hypothetical protein B0H16DRAFT_1484903 [Mycena metata]|uniref:Uncharacterized protein n=1 Tax=Mycena metata TaxID=1033252 RepID=A0AAD7GP29_9AGAR|nr:hypothetical protein B0H16DRAFT_1484903 [Mycena metata]
MQKILKVTFVHRGRMQGVRTLTHPSTFPARSRTAVRTSGRRNTMPTIHNVRATPLAFAAGSPYRQNTLPSFKSTPKPKRKSTRPTQPLSAGSSSQPDVVEACACAYKRGREEELENLERAEGEGGVEEDGKGGGGRKAIEWKGVHKKGHGVNVASGKRQVRGVCARRRAQRIGMVVGSCSAGGLGNGGAGMCTRKVYEEECERWRKNVGKAPRKPARGRVVREDGAGVRETEWEGGYRQGGVQLKGGW